MSPCRAPTALRTPISRVRSLTDTSMMFITPIPPTIRPMEAMTMVMTKSTWVSCCHRSLRKLAVKMEKSLGLSGGTFRRRRRWYSTSSMAAVIRDGSSTEKAMETSFTSG